MKRILSLVIAVITVLTLMACSKQKTEVNVAVSDVVEEIKNKIIADMKAGGASEDMFKDGMVPGYLETDLTEAQANDPMLEFFNSEDIEEGIVLQQMINIKSDLIIVVKAKDESNVAGIKESLDKVREQQENIWSTYLPDQYDKVKNNIIKTSGKYLIYVTYDDPESIESIFDNALE